MHRLLQHLTRIIGGLFLFFAVALVAYLVVAPRVMAGATLTVLTGSMSPTIPAGSVVLIKPVEDPLTIESGTVITFQASPTERVLVTHRVVRFQPETEPPSYITKGDANRGVDVAPVPIGAIRGEVVAHVPYLGLASTWLGGGRGPFVIAVGIALVIIATQSRRLFTALRDQDPASDPHEPDTNRVDAVLTDTEALVSTDASGDDILERPLP